MRPHRQPTRPRRPWDSPGKNTGMGCHFLLHKYTTLLVICNFNQKHHQSTDLYKAWCSWKSKPEFTASMLGMGLLSLHGALLITKQFCIYFLRWFLEYLCDVDAVVHILCLKKAYLPLQAHFPHSLNLSPVSPDPQQPSSQSVFPANWNFLNVLIAAPPISSANKIKFLLCKTHFLQTFA